MLVFLLMPVGSCLSIIYWFQPTAIVLRWMLAMAKVANAGLDGLPELPAIDSITDSFASTARGIDSQVHSLQSQLAKIEQTGKERITREKGVFEARLKEEEKKNQVIMQENAALAKQIMAVHSNNEKLLNKVRAEVKSNEAKRKGISALLKKIVEAHTAAEKVLADTDDSNAPELSFLRKSKQTKEKAVEVKARDEKRASESKEEPVSFVQIEEFSLVEPEEALSLKHDDKADEPESLVGALTKSIEVLRVESKHSEEKLKQLFAESFKAETQRHSALTAQQELLKKRLSDMQAFEEKLKKADDHLLSVEKTLQDRMLAESKFLGELSTAAMSPEQEVKQQLSLLHLSTEREF
jgi:hypothetical protein